MGVGKYMLVTARTEGVSLFISELLKVLILGLVEGITEWLPISSTGHMILVEEFIQLQASQAFKEMFFVVIQLGAIMAVVLLYFHKLNPFSRNKTKREKRMTFDIWYKVIIGVIPAGVLGVLFDDWLNTHFYNYQTVAVTLILYGILFILVENRNKGRMSTVNSFNEMTYKTAFLIGVFQVLSLIPGTSRSGATILGAIILGTSRHIAAEYSFFLSIPVMFGASALKLVKFGLNFTGSEIIILLTGMIVAFLVSILAIKFLLGYIKRNDFKAFGWYRIVLGLIVLGYFIIFG
jgi:undecaprenyl-diphosphatase